MPLVIRRRLAGLLALGLGAAGATSARADGVTVFAAASLKTAMDEIADGFAAATGDRATVSLAGSSALARQIQQRAPADVFISANEAWMDALDQGGRIAPGTRFDLARNRLVLIAHGADAPPVEIGPELDLPGLLKGSRLAMALVEAVPAGIYGKAALESLILADEPLAALDEAVVVAHHDDGLTELDAAGIRLVLPRVPHSPGTRIRVRIPATDVILSRTRPEGLSALNILPGTVEALRPGEGPGTLVSLRTPAGTVLALITRRSARSLELAPGAACHEIVKTVAMAPEDVGEPEAWDG